MVQSLHHLNCLWDLSQWSVTLECLDVHALLRSGQSQWMASLRTIVRALREVLEEYILDFPLPRKDCSFMSPLPGRLLYLGMSFVMKPLPPLLLRLGNHSMMPWLLDPLLPLFLIHTLWWNILEICCHSLRRGMLQPTLIKQQQLLLLRKTSSIQTSFQILWRIPVKRKLLLKKAMRMKSTQILSLRLWMMDWIPRLGDPAELGTHQNFWLLRIFRQLGTGKRWPTMRLTWNCSQLVRQKPRSHPSISMLWILLHLCLHLWESDQSWRCQIWKSEKLGSELTRRRSRLSLTPKLLLWTYLRMENQWYQPWRPTKSRLRVMDPWTNWNAELWWEVICKIQQWRIPGHLQHLSDLSKCS